MLASGLFFQGGWYFFRLKIILNGYRPFVGCFPGRSLGVLGYFVPTCVPVFVVQWSLFMTRSLGP